MKAIDFHVHLPTPEWLDVSMKGYIEAAESYFRSRVARKSLDDLASEYRSMDMVAVLLAWDAETATGRPRVPNDLVAEACRTYPDAFVGYPWHLELLAMALHKTNIYIDISGWAPRYIPTEVLRDMKGRLQDQFLFGSDYPFLQPQRCLDELHTLDIPPPVLQKVLIDNGKRLLGIA